MDTEAPIFAKSTYSLDDAIGKSVSVEALYGYIDIGPVDSLDPAILKREYDLFFGSSPLSSPSPSPEPSRSASPTEPAPGIQAHRLCDALNSLPCSRPTSRNMKDRPKPCLPVDAHHDPEPPRSDKAARRRKKSHANRCRKRQEFRAQQDGNSLPYANSHKHIARAESITTSYDTNTIPSASSGFISLPDTHDRGSKVFETKELLAGGKFRLIRWNGMCVSFTYSNDSKLNETRVTRAIVDKDGRIIAVLAGSPNDADWASVHRSAYAALQTARRRCRFPKKTTTHRRGNFPALSAGISFGGGQKVSQPASTLTSASNIFLY